MAKKNEPINDPDIPDSYRDGEANPVVNGHELEMTRILNATRELVWEVWTDPKHVSQWWGPRRFTSPVCELDLKPGGKILIHMKGPDGIIYPMNGTYLEIVEPERIIFISAALDANGNQLFEIHNTIVFTEEGGKTKLTMRAKVSKVTPEAAPYLAGMNEGWKQTLDKLEEYLVQNLN